MADMCLQVKSPVDAGYKSLFTLVSLIRLAAGLSDEYFLPRSWSDEFVTIKITCNGFNEEAAGASLCNCRNLDQLKRGVESSGVAVGHRIVVLLPQGAILEQYDVVMAYLIDNVVQEVRGFKVDIAQARPSDSANEGIYHSFFLSGDPPAEAVLYNGWHVVSDWRIDAFFGFSGRSWTPHAWKLLSSSFKNDLNNMEL